jgi:hypothetical protein
MDRRGGLPSSWISYTATMGSGIGRPMRSSAEHPSSRAPGILAAFTSRFRPNTEINHRAELPAEEPSSNPRCGFFVTAWPICLYSTGWPSRNTNTPLERPDPPSAELLHASLVRRLVCARELPRERDFAPTLSLLMPAHVFLQNFQRDIRHF